MFVVGINGSPRKKGMTAKFLKIVLKEVDKNGGKTLLIHLIDKKINPCLGCDSTGNCKYPCVQKDDMQEIYKLLERADGIVLASPTYWFCVSGITKNFIDRLDSMAIAKLLRNKIGGFIATSEESGGGEVSGYLLHVMNEMGLIIPPYAAPFFVIRKGKNITRTWALIDLKNLGKNIILLFKALKKTKLAGPPKTMPS